MVAILSSSISARAQLPAARRISAPRPAMRAARVVTRAQAGQEEPTASTSSPIEAVPATPLQQQAPVASTSGSAAAAMPFSILGDLQESINGRAAMLGFVAAVAVELQTDQSVWSQLAGKYVDGDLVQRAIGASDMSYAFAVVALTLATFAPLVYKNERPGARSFGPFTPGLEKALGRTAMLGFAGLVVVELLRGNVALF